MELKAGYKQTEVGVIPKDWNIEEVSKIGTINGRVGWKGYTKKDLVEVGPYAIGAKHINKNNKLDLTNPTCLTFEKYIESPEIMVYKDDLLIVQRGTIGKIVLIESEIGEATINPSMLILRSKKIPSKYIYYYLISEKGQKQINLDTSSTGVPMITQKQVLNFKIPLPPSLREQNSIATALSDIDSWITRLEQLIAKKRLLKQGAMQELLKPKEGWEVKKLGEMVHLITKGTTPTSVGKQFQKQGINFIKIESILKNGEIDYRKVAFIDESTNEILSRSKIEEGDILFSIAGALGRTTIVKKSILPANTNQALGIIRLKNNILNKYFLFYFFSKSEFQKMLNTIAVTGAQPNISLRNINEFDIYFPRIEEQYRIAIILSDMDSELSALENKLEKAKKIKMGMMQELLSGRIRLV